MIDWLPHPHQPPKESALFRHAPSSLARQPLLALLLWLGVAPALAGPVPPQTASALAQSEPVQALAEPVRIGVLAARGPALAEAQWQALVGAVNAWFQQAEERDGPGAFLFGEPGQTESVLPFVPVQAKGRAEVLVDGGGALPAIQVIHALDGVRPAKQALRPYAAACAEQIVTWLNDAAVGFAQEGNPFQRLRPADVAVLVRDGKEGEAIRRGLRHRKVGPG